MIEIPKGCVNVILGMYRGVMTRVKTIMWKGQSTLKLKLHYTMGLR